jgi:Cellulase (glycosyl hydrolase family 5)
MQRVLVRSAVVLVALVAVASAGGAVSATAPKAPKPPPARLWLGFQDDSSFRWGTSRDAMLDRAMRAGTTIFRTNVYWSQIAPTRPANARDPFDPAYKFDDLDQLARAAQQRGISLFLTIWGTPDWANGGDGQNYAPTSVGDLNDFAYALASRYSGRYPGYPYVGFYSVWNEPNLQQFLAPQFDAKGKPVAPAIYGAMYKAGYAGIKAANPTAQVAIGETSPRGHDKVVSGVQPSESPGRFAQALSKVKGLKFDAWAHHPYPTAPGLPPTQQARFPNVTLAQLPLFEKSLDTWFKRKNIPIWVTEYAYQSKPPGTLGVTLAKQALYLTQGLTTLERDPRVKLVIWFTFGDTLENPWKSGVVGESGAGKPSLTAFTKNAAAVTTRNNTVAVSSKRSVQAIRLSALPIAYYEGPGAQVGLDWRLFSTRGISLTANQRLVTVGRDGWVTLPVTFRPKKGGRYVLKVSGSDRDGHPLVAKLTLVAVT